MSLGIDIGELSKLFFDFEDEFAGELKNIRYRELIVWPIVKSPLYFSLLHPRGSQMEPSEITPAKQFTIFYRIGLQCRKLSNLLALLYQLGKIKYGKKGKGKSILFYAFAGDKLTKDASGKFMNSLVDEFILGKIVTDYLYAEKSFDGDFKLPAVVHADLNLDNLDAVSSWYRLKNKSNRELSDLAALIFAMFNRFLERRGQGGLINEKEIHNILIAFTGEYEASIFLLKAVKPAAIITSEKPGTGLMAAANKLNIVAVDMQHGIIDRFHPQYVYSGRMKEVKSQMSLPVYIGLFGELHKEILLKESFWDNNDLQVLGSSRVEHNREKYITGDDNRDKGQITVLIPTQWTFFDDTKKLLDTLLSGIAAKYIIVLKIHPHEPESNIIFYKQLQQQYPQHIRISEKNDDIYNNIIAADLIIGFNSAVLLETVSLMKPCITITTPVAPNGIHQLIGDKRLERAIRKVSISDTASMISLIRSTEQKDAQYINWLTAAGEESYSLYAGGYYKNCQLLINKIFSAN